MWPEHWVAILSPSTPHLCSIPKQRLSRELQEKEKVIEVLRAKLDAQSLTRSSSHALSDSHRSPSSTSFLSDELEACSDMDITSFHFHSIPKLASLPQAALPSAPSSFLPFSPTGPPLLGGCETPVVPLAEAQQELQKLQKQLGESKHFCICVLAKGSHTLCCSAWLGLDCRV
ncbi:myomegalin-like isoform X3 [Pongo abelii]|uniref:myomegalin-like isoform X3 n=1 Tax=Pongo abelii TaxID=9601 RepID=UPI003003B343